MKKTITALIALAAIAGPVSPALANGPKHCPPGLAKKSPACIPPGLAKKNKHDDKAYREHEEEHHREYRRYVGDDYGDYRRGDRIPDGYELILVPTEYGLSKRDYDYDSDYYVVDGVLYEVSRETREVIDLFRAVGAVLN